MRRLNQPDTQWLIPILNDNKASAVEGQEEKKKNILPFLPPFPFFRYNTAFLFRNGMTISVLLLLLSTVIGCASLKQAQQRKQERIQQEQKARYLTFERPTTEIEASSDGLKIESQHYTLTFADDLLKNKDFDEVKERQEMGQGALVFMESLYNYVNGIFGFEPNHRINVTLHELYQGTTQLATTQITYKTFYQNGEILKQVDGIEMNFPLAMFNDRSVRAHELTHAFTNTYLLPTWFGEGIAVLVQLEYAKGAGHGKVDIRETLKLDFDGVNAIQNWRGHSNSIPALSSWGYDYSYSLVSELKARFGEGFYPKLFHSIEADGIGQKPGAMSTSVLVYYMSQAAGQDLVPFFEGLKFNIRRLTKAEILSIIKQSSQ